MYDHIRQAKSVTYNGQKFRSTLEGKWAVFFTTMGWRWHYEAERYDLGDGDDYLPDFKVWIGSAPPFHFEVKPDLYSISAYDWSRMRKFADVIILDGPPEDKLYQSAKNDVFDFLKHCQYYQLIKAIEASNNHCFDFGNNKVLLHHTLNDAARIDYDRSKGSLIDSESKVLYGSEVLIVPCNFKLVEDTRIHFFHMINGAGPKYMSFTGRGVAISQRFMARMQARLVNGKCPSMYTNLVRLSCHGSIEFSIVGEVTDEATLAKAKALYRSTR